MYNILTYKKRESLILQLKTERDKKGVSRINAVFFLMKAGRPPQIARALFLGEDANKFLCGYLSYGEEKRL